VIEESSWHTVCIDTPSMRVNLQAAYTEIKRYLSPSHKETGGSSTQFSKLLADVSPERQIELERTLAAREAELTANIKVPQPSPMASLRLSSPKTEAPPLTMLQPSGIAPEPQVADVKTPSLLDVRRLGEKPAAASPEGDIQQPVLEPGKAEVKEIIREAGIRHGVDPNLGLAVASAESSFDIDAVSSDGHESKGLFQLLDKTAHDLLKRTNASTDSYQPFNPEMNVDLGLRYLRYLHDLFSSDKALPNKMTTVAAANSSSLEKLAVAAFNAGEGRVASAQERARRAGKDPSEYAHVEPYLPEITQKYVQRVLQEKDRFGGLTFS
jgi:soluble lytic murein transglycosylase-like protein